MAGIFPVARLERHADAARLLAQLFEVEARGRQHLAVGRVDVAVPELLLEAEALGKLEHDPDVAFRFAARFDDRRAELGVRRRIRANFEVGAQALALPRRVDRQHDVGERRRGRHEHVDMHREVERLQRFQTAHRIRMADQDVGAEAHHALDRIGRTLEDRTIEIVGGDPAALLRAQRSIGKADRFRFLLG